MQTLQLARTTEVYKLAEKAQALIIADISNRRELLIDFADGINIHDGDRDNISKLVDIYLKNVT